MPKFTWWQWVLFGFAGLVVIGSLNRCMNPDGVSTTDVAPPIATAPADPLEGLRRANRDLRNVSIAGDKLHVEATVSSLDDAAGTVRAVGEWLAKNHGVTAQTLEAYFTVESIDRLGNKGQAGLAAATFAVSDLRAAKFDNLTRSSILGLATAVETTSPLGLQEVAGWCANEVNTEFTGADFCRLALS